MISKWMKRGVIATVGATLVGGLLFGGDLMSYVKSSANSVRGTVKGAVPIEFELTRAGPATLTVHDVRGALIRTLTAENRARGPHEILWDGRTDDGGRAPAGVYFVRLETPQGSSRTKVTRLP